MNRRGNNSRCIPLLALIAGLTVMPSWAAGTVVNELLTVYTAQGAGPFSASTGAALWTRQYSSTGGKTRACTTCHGTDLRKSGRHVQTGKVIEPLAPSVVATRFTDRAEIDKWFLRNCRWTLGRECTDQEKGDLLTFMAAQ